MNTHARPNPTSRIAALHTQGDTARVLIAERDGAAVRVLATESLPSADTASLRAILERHAKPALIRVIPGASAITRVVRVPSGTSDELRAALDLIAEAELPSAIPAHRRAAGIIPTTHANGTVSALLLGWPIADAPEPITDDDRFTTETAALNALLAPIEGASAAYADKHAGSIALFARDGEAFIVRAMREDPAEPTRWREALTTACHTVGAIDDHATTGGLLIDQTAAAAAIARVRGAKADRDWLDRYAIALGAAIGALSDSPSVRPLYALKPQRERIALPLHTRALTALATPRNAIATIAAALLIALLAPLAGAFVQYQILRAKSGSLEERQAAERAADERAALYAELTDRTWPMTKLLADLSGLIPEGVRVESVQLVQGDEIRLSGSADSADLLSDMQSKVAASGVFDEPTLPRIERGKDSAAATVEFDLSARVARPFVTPRGAEDYTEQTLAVRLYGEEAVARYPEDITTLVSPDEPASSGGASASSRRASRDRDSADEDGGSSRTRARASDGESQTVPPPLTDEQIATMERADLVKEFGLRRKASSYPELDPADEQRLKDEVNKIRERLANRGGG